MIALKSHQMSRLEHIRDETNKLRQYLQSLRNDVLRLETQKEESLPEGVNWATKVSKLREDNRSLRIECHCLSMEVDLYASGRMPLGITDENFYKNIPGGPNGSLVTRVERSAQPPSYEESIIFPPPRFGALNTAPNFDILRQVPPAPRPVWLSPQVQQPIGTHSGQSPPLIPPRPNSASPRTPPIVTQSQTSNNQTVEEGQRWVCEKCTVENHPALAYCEVCEMPRNAYLGIKTVLNIDSNQYECYCHCFDQ